MAASAPPEVIQSDIIRSPKLNKVQDLTFLNIFKHTWLLEATKKFREA